MKLEIMVENEMIDIDLFFIKSKKLNLYRAKDAKGILPGTIGNISHIILYFKTRQKIYSERQKIWDLKCGS
tara:strand:- start:1562 stop:1774 length:213 start_codon:yes stop_codon:yes gene_type:complete